MWVPMSRLQHAVFSRGEHLLLFLVQTVARQTVEHCQYRPPRIREDRNRKTASPEGERTNTSVTVCKAVRFVCLTLSSLLFRFRYA